MTYVLRETFASKRQGKPLWFAGPAMFHALSFYVVEGPGSHERREDPGAPRRWWR